MSQPIFDEMSISLRALQIALEQAELLREQNRSEKLQSVPVLQVMPKNIKSSPQNPPSV